MIDILFAYSIDPLFEAVLQKMLLLSLAIVFSSEWIIWGFLDGRLKKFLSFMRPWILLNLLIVFVSISLFYLVFNHLFLAAVITYLLTLALVTAHIIKFRVLGLPVFFWDYIVLREPLLYIPVLIQKKSTYIVLLLGIGVVVGSFYFILLLPAEPSGWPQRSVVFATSCIIVFVGFYFSRVPYKKFFPANSFRDSIVFKTGLLPFIVLTARYSKASPAPGGYSQETMVGIVKKYEVSAEHAQIEGVDTLPNLIFYGIESLMDPTSFGVDYSNHPMPFFSSLGKENGEGIFVSPTFGGQTVQPEFELLTGLSQHHLSIPNPFVHIIEKYKEFPALSAIFKERGYQCWGIQAVKALEFQRRQYYPLIGFDHFVALETDFPKEDWQMIHHLLADAYLVNKIKSLIPIDDKPIFAMCFTNSTHISYDSWERQEQFTVLNRNCTEKTRDILERYATAINQADQALEKLVSYFQQQARKTMIVAFGDHLPGVSSVFQDLGVFKGNQGFHRFHTPLRIWSNFELPREDRIVSANLLPALIMDLLDMDGHNLPLHLQLVRELYKQVDVFSSYIRDKSGEVHSRQNPPDFIKELGFEYDLAQYDCLEGLDFAKVGKR